MAYNWTIPQTLTEWHCYRLFAVAKFHRTWGGTFCFCNCHGSPV